MQAATLHIPTAAPAAPAAQAAQFGARRASQRQPHFAEVVTPNDFATDRAKLGREGEARRAAQQLVASTLVLPILAESRKDPFRSEMFHGGKGEDLFGAQLDQIIADRVTSAANFPLVDTIYRSMIQKGTPAAGRLDTRG